MHSFYLRSCYVGNEFARGELELAGTRLSPAGIEADLYVLAAEADHIAPWRSSFEAVRLFSSSAVRFVLTSSGHIAGIVNPPSPKSAHWTDGEPTSDPEHWLATATRRDGSWWRTGSRGSRPVPEAGSRRPRSGARCTHHSVTHPASTSTRSDGLQ